jgi:hypothetical protein
MKEPTVVLRVVIHLDRALKSKFCRALKSADGPN